VEFITHNLDGKARGAIAFVVGGVCVVIQSWQGEFEMGCRMRPGFGV